MSDRIMLKMTASEDWIIVKTVTKAKKSSSLYFRRDGLLALENTSQVVARDYSFAVFTRNTKNDTIFIRFYWMNTSGTGPFTGWEQEVSVPAKPFLDFVRWSAYEDQPQSWHSLSLSPRHAPRLIFMGTRNLHDAISDKLTRRKLCKFLRSNFRWRDSTEILFYDDFIPRSFLFREMRHDDAGICGGLILHGQEDMKTAYYSIHT